MHPSEAEVLSFLTSLFHSGEGYSAINTARCALSSFMSDNRQVTIGNFVSIKRFLKGVFELRPSMPRYEHIWDVDIVLDFLRNYYPYEGMPLSILTMKLVMLLALTTAQRVQTLHSLNLENVEFQEDLVIIPISDFLKQTSVRNRKFALYLHAYKADTAICVVEILKEYINRTRNIRGKENYLLISFLKPYRRVGKQTISRWLRKVMFEAGIDTEVYKSHSTRSASVSKARSKFVPADFILKVAGWTSSHCFKKFYDNVIRYN